MKKMLLIAAVFLAGCGPQYKTFTTYTPPMDDKGRECAQKCFNEKIQCDEKAEAVYRLCQKEAQLNGRQDYLNAKENYLNRLDDWNRNRRKCERDNPSGGCKHLDASKPSEPDLSNYMRLYPCSKEDEKCVERYDTCFEICGGRITREVRCVSNCQ